MAGYGTLTILQRHARSQVGRGRITTVIGPNGAGKSTVFKAIFGLLPVRAGTHRLPGQRHHEPARRARCSSRGICYVPQGRNIFPELSVRANLEFGAVSR